VCIYVFVLGPHLTCKNVSFYCRKGTICRFAQPVIQVDYGTEEANVIEDTDSGMCEMRGHSRKLCLNPITLELNVQWAPKKKKTPGFIFFFLDHTVQLL
jgi:hypothetical protein